MAENFKHKQPGAVVSSEQLTIPVGVVTLDITKYKDANGEFAGAADFIVEDENIRITRDGTTPNPATQVGKLFLVGDYVKLTTQAEIEGFKAIREGAADGNIFVDYYKKKDINQA